MQVIKQEDAPMPSALHDNSPTVSMDIRLGAEYQNVDFDYAAFDREADRQGMPDEVRAELQVYVGPYRSRLSMGMQGTYHQGANRIEVAAGPTVNNRLIHEVQHATDDVHGRLVADARQRLGLRSALASNYTGVTTGSAEVLAMVAGIPIPEKVTAAVVAINVALGAAALYGYYSHPMERRARVAARQSTETILRFDKR